MSHIESTSTSGEGDDDNTFHSRLREMLEAIPEPLMIVCHPSIAQKVEDALAQLPVNIPLPVVRAEIWMDPGKAIVLDPNQIRKDICG